MFAVICALVIVYLLQLYFRYRKVAQGIRDHPGLYVALDHTFAPANALPHIPGFALGNGNFQRTKHAAFQDFGWDIISVGCVWPRPKASLLLASASAIKEVTSSRTRFPKAVEHYTLLKDFGPNIIASEHDDWKRYRKISASAFSDRNTRLVWAETVHITADMLQDLWHHEETVVVEHGADLTLSIALHVISAAAFGRRISWKDDKTIPPGHRLTFKDAVHTASSGVYIKLAVPKWAMGLSRKFREVREAYEEMEQYMMEMIEGSGEAREERDDLLSSLLAANQEEVKGVKLDNCELLGNIFIFLVAGHETTAHALCFAFALLALYQEEQEKLFDHIKTVLPDGRLPAYDDMPNLTYSLAVLYETLRMFPPVSGLPKVSAEDTVLIATNAAGEQKAIPVPKGTEIGIHTAGLHFNPQYWEDPHAFKPARFLGDWPRDAYLPFNAGARSCLGRKFFEASSLVILSILISRYKIEIKEEPQFAGETFRQREERILAFRAAVTVTPVRVPLVFKRRV